MRKLIAFCLFAVACGGSDHKAHADEIGAQQVMLAATSDRDWTNANIITTALQIGEKTAFYNQVATDYNQHFWWMTQEDRDFVLAKICQATLELADANQQHATGIHVSNNIAEPHYQSAKWHYSVGNWANCVAEGQVAIYEFGIARSHLHSAVFHSNKCFNYCVEADIVLRRYREGVPPGGD